MAITRAFASVIAMKTANHQDGLTEINLLVLDELCLAPADILAITAPCLRGNFTPIIRFGTSPRQGSVWNKSGENVSE